MKDYLNKFATLRIIQVALIIGITILAYYEKDGWGWLVFALIATL